MCVSNKNIRFGIIYLLYTMLDNLVMEGFIIGRGWQFLVACFLNVTEWLLLHASETMKYQFLLLDNL